MDNDSERRDALRKYAEHVGGGDYASETFDDAYCGVRESEEEYAWELAEDIYNVSSRARAGTVPACYFDIEAFTRDLFISDYFSERAPGGRVYIFRAL